MDQATKERGKNFIAKISRQINDIRDTGPDTENTDHGPDMAFYGPLVNRIRIGFYGPLVNQNREF